MRRIADAVANGRHCPDHPSYRAFVAEVIAQYRAMPVRVSWTRGTITGTSGDLFRQCDSGVLTIATDGSPFAAEHPLAVVVPEFERPVNDLFRAVHDYWGHYRNRVPFETFEGELAAYRAHSRMFSDSAQVALFSETIAQLCWYYTYGDFVPVQVCLDINPRLINSLQETR